MESITSVNPSEYAPFYETYVRRVPEGEISEILSDQIDDTLSLLNAVPAELETYRYGTGKWSVREVVGHVIDVERVFCFRALAFARGDSTPLPGMDQVQYAVASDAGRRPLPELAAELAAVRAATVALFGSFSVDAWSREGIASGCSFTVRSFPFIIAGHELHHRAGLAENYLSQREHDAPAVGPRGDRDHDVYPKSCRRPECVFSRLPGDTVPTFDLWRTPVLKTRSPF